jgi:hypothetical protein
MYSATNMDLSSPNKVNSKLKTSSVRNLVHIVGFYFFLGRSLILTTQSKNNWYLLLWTSIFKVVLCTYMNAKRSICNLKELFQCEIVYRVCQSRTLIKQPCEDRGSCPHLIVFIGFITIITLSYSQ